ncbi:TPA: gp58-like family protein [Streptococcus pyogenes]|uniref:gp58-like family protein n=4 Tax=Streptococcus pyogenes TaxID=1314 RepID=UPI00132FCD06|nr:gp58-like family protein [Streptococcus pyogenes]HER4545133.1 gp58-like family protein [Streptococcus pyogenes NGAS675]HER4548641.1 gp58-like family protein [Streptococcus pyogenes NGAS670]HER4759509.1 gp58-like family protein [Streptococcus pyogenes NGAS245]HEP1548799.1 gp58-like family protein [Streptococcus pyogenes]HEP4237404.1 gp58-like family protein [Streptococcus pyogenes]
MSRDPTLLIDESNLTIGSDGRAYYTFTADGDTKSVKIANNKCIGTTRFNQLMIERGGKPTNYVAPVVVEGTGNPTGLFKDLKEISLELTDTKNSKLWSKIKLNNQGMIEEYYNGTIKSEIIKTAEGTQQRISSETDKKLALINETVSGIRREYRDADRKLSASYQAGIEGLKATMANDKIGLQAEIKASAQGLSQKYDNELRQLSAKITTTSSGTTEAYENKLNSLRAEFTRSNQGTRTELESQISGLRAVQQTTASQISQEIRNREGAVSRVQQGLDSYQRRLQSAEGNYNSLRETVAGYERRISNQDNTISSNFTQLKTLIDQSVTLEKVQSLLRQSGDSIMLAIKDKLPKSKMSGNEIISAINLNSHGVQIAGKNITLDGNTTVNGAFTTKIANAIKIKADQIIAGVIDAAKIRVINLNASSIVGLDANFIKAKIGYAITDLLEGKVIKARNGAMLIDLNTAKMDFNSDATINFNSKNNALVRKDGTHTAFVHFSNATPKGYTGSALYASIGITSSGDGVNSASSGRFAGLRSFRYATGYNHTAAVDQTEIYGDNVLIADDFNINRGFKFRPDKMTKMIDMNDLYAAVVALGRCWKHLANVGWNTVHGNFVSAVNGELNNYITKI